ncbi:Exopolygalacturonase, partial [Cucurbita argyrosperma subsp. sororia]
MAIAGRFDIAVAASAVRGVVLGLAWLSCVARCSSTPAPQFSGDFLPLRGRFLVNTAPSTRFLADTAPSTPTAPSQGTPSTPSTPTAPSQDTPTAPSQGTSSTPIAPSQDTPTAPGPGTASTPTAPSQGTPTAPSPVTPSAPSPSAPATPSTASTPATPGTKVFDITTYGAKPDGKKINTQAFMKAWVEACHSGGPAKVVFPPGKFLTGPLVYAGPCDAPMTVEIQGTVLATTDVTEYSSPPPSKVKISDVSYKNIRGTTISVVPVSLQCSSAVPCDGITLEDIDLAFIGSDRKKALVGNSCLNAKFKATGKQNPPACA